MSYKNLYQQVKSGVFHIMYVRKNGQGVTPLGGGTGFFHKNKLITNNHVFACPQCDYIYLRSYMSTPNKPDSNHDVVIPYQQWQGLLNHGSPAAQFDYAVLDLSNVSLKHEPYSFEIVESTDAFVGKEIAILGFPLDTHNLTFHIGIISSIQEKELPYTAEKLIQYQIQTSVNSGNSGGPLLDLSSGRVIGIVTRKADGLSQIFDDLEEAISNNLEIAIAASRGASMVMNGVDQMQANIANVASIQQLIVEIRRSANVGIGYAFSTKHVFRDL